MASSCLATEKKRLLGELENGIYTSPSGFFSFELPAKSANNKDATVNDFISPTSLNINIEDSSHNTRHRIVYGYLIEGTYLKTLEKRLFQYQNLMTRTFEGDALLVHFDEHENTNRYLFKQAGKQGVRFHYFQSIPFKDRIILVWSDFTRPDDTPESEDKVINGDHPAIRSAQALIKSIK